MKLVSGSSRAGPPPRVGLVADTNAMNRRFLHAVMARLDFELIYEAETARDLYHCLADTSPAVVLVDAGISDEPIDELVRHVRDLTPDAAVVVLSPHQAVLDAAVAAGVVAARKQGFLQLDGIEAALRAASATPARPAPPAEPVVA